MVKPSELGRQWQELTSRKRVWRERDDLVLREKTTPVANQSTLPTDDNTCHDNDDPFDCSSVMVPSEREAVDAVLDQFLPRWKDLDSRKVPPPVDPTRRKKRVRFSHTVRHGWQSHTRLRLPEGFNIADTQEPPPPPPPPPPDEPFHNEQETTLLNDTAQAPVPPEEKVVSLEDPTQLLSYRQELWKLFQEIPTNRQVQANVLLGHKCQHTMDLYDAILQQGSNRQRGDLYGLHRLRSKDRHGLAPPVTWRETDKVNTVRLEFWRRQPRKGPSVDAMRMELEFRTGQTLLDVHRAIVEMCDDVLWRQSKSDENDGTGHSANESGLFLIESVLYVTGSKGDDYAAPIQEWLKPKDPRDGIFGSGRRHYLGLFQTGNDARQNSDDDDFGRQYDVTNQDKYELPFQVKQMADTTLQDLDMRLGVRYYHVCHGDVECAVFFTDYSHETAKAVPPHYPIIHDPWGKSYTSHLCDACTERPASLVLSHERTDGGPRLLCMFCHGQLFDEEKEERLTKRQKGRVHIWRGDSDLTPAHDANEAMF